MNQTLLKVSAVQCVNKSRLSKTVDHVPGGQVRAQSRPCTRPWVLVEALVKHAHRASSITRPAGQRCQPPSGPATTLTALITHAPALRPTAL